jgi:small subunit ribosomal protein S21
MYLLNLKLITIFALPKKINFKRKRYNMIIIPVKEGENIDRVLKKYKRKFEKTGVVKELRERQKFTKPSIVNREQRLKAIYIQQLRQNEEG